MKKAVVIAILLGGCIAQAGVVSVVKHLSKDVYHVVKYQVVGVVHAVKHAASDVKTVAR